MHAVSPRAALMRPAVAAFAALLIAPLLISKPAAAAPPADPGQPERAERPGRYILQPVDGGVLRMDSETGAMSLCVKRNAAITCEPIPDERTGQKEAERLGSENRELKADIKRLEEQMGLGDKPASGPPAGGPPNSESPASGPSGTDKTDGERPVSRSSKFNLPTEREIDQALNYVERMVKKLREKWKDIEGSANGRGTAL